MYGKWSTKGPQCKSESNSSGKHEYSVTYYSNHGLYQGANLIYQERHDARLLNGCWESTQSRRKPGTIPSKSGRVDLSFSTDTIRKINNEPNPSGARAEKRIPTPGVIWFPEDDARERGGATTI